MVVKMTALIPAPPHLASTTPGHACGQSGGRDTRLTGKVYIEADDAPLDESHQGTGTLDLFSSGAAGGDIGRE